MARRAHKDLNFDVPDDWQDRTILAFAAPPRPGKVSQPNIVVTREVLPAGQTLRAYSSKQLTSLAKSLPRFELEDSKDVNVAGVAGVDLRFTWEGDNGPLSQRQVIVVYRDAVYNITASAPRSEAAQIGPTFDAMIATIQFPGSSLRPV